MEYIILSIHSLYVALSCGDQDAQNCDVLSSCLVSRSVLRKCSPRSCWVNLCSSVFVDIPDFVFLVTVGSVGPVGPVGPVGAVALDCTRALFRRLLLGGLFCSSALSFIKSLEVLIKF